MTTATETAAPEAKKPFYKNVFFLGFLVGIVFLTLLRFLQPVWLSAPAPLGGVAPFELRDQTGATVSLQSLQGSVWIAVFCDAPCAETATLAKMVKPLSDLRQKVPVIAIANAPVSEAPQGVQVLSGPPEALTEVSRSFSAAFAQQPHRGSVSPYLKKGALGMPPMLAVVDQAGAIRGFWPPDELGQGNSINAARLLTKHGPRP